MRTSFLVLSCSFLLACGDDITMDQEPCRFDLSGVWDSYSIGISTVTGDTAEGFWIDSIVVVDSVGIEFYADTYASFAGEWHWYTNWRRDAKHEDLDCSWLDFASEPVSIKWLSPDIIEYTYKDFLTTRTRLR